MENINWNIMYYVNQFFLGDWCHSLDYWNQKIQTRVLNNILEKEIAVRIG